MRAKTATFGCRLPLLVVALFGIVLQTQAEIHEDQIVDVVLQVHVNFRHGDRTPEYFYPKDPHRNINFYPNGLGQLTNRGKQRMYKLGQFLRERYNDFLGMDYNEDIVDTLTTDFDRTKMSAMLVLAGLFPPTNVSQQWSPDNSLPWLPIPYQYRPHTEDTFLKRPNDYCPTYMNELKFMLKTEGEEHIKNNSDIFRLLEENVGEPVKTLKKAFDIYQILWSEDTMGLILPEWTLPCYPEPLATIAAQQCQIESGNTMLKRLNGGNLLRKYLRNARDKIDGKLKPEGRKIYLYSGHETNVVNVLYALNLTFNQVPMYGDAHIFELVYRNATNQYGFKLFYHNQRTNKTELLDIPGCSQFCDYDKFINLTEPVVPKNYTKECGAQISLDEF